MGFKLKDPVNPVQTSGIWKEEGEIDRMNRIKQDGEAMGSILIILSKLQKSGEKRGTDRMNRIKQNREKRLDSSCRNPVNPV